MKTLLFSALLILLFCIPSFSQGLICVQGTTTAQFTNSLTTALSLAQSGDYIYLPGGLVSGTGTTITVGKPVHIIGCGYNPDSSQATGPTRLTQPLDFISAATGSTISGIYTSDDIIIHTNNISITRCNMNSIVAFSGYANIYIAENIIRNYFSNGSTLTYTFTNLVITKNFIMFGIDGISSGATISNNDFLKPGGSNLINGVSNSYFVNNIFACDSVTFSAGAGTNNIFENNLYTISPSAFISFNFGTTMNNIFSESLSNIFVNATNTAWSSTKNYHLKSTCLGVARGTDGRDIGGLWNQCTIQGRRDAI